MMRPCGRCYSAGAEPQPPNLEILIRTLTAEHVRFVLIGGFAILLHGGLFAQEGEAQLKGGSVQ